VRVMDGVYFGYVPAHWWDEKSVKETDEDEVETVYLRPLGLTVC